MTIDSTLNRPGPPGAPPATESEHRTSPIGALTVVVIEDQRAIAEMLAEALAEHGFRPVLLGPPYRTDRITASGAAVLLLDIALGRESGWDILDAVRIDPATRDLPTIITSAMYDRPGLHTLPAGGPITFVPKPFDIDDLIATIRRLANREQDDPGGATHGWR